MRAAALLAALALVAAPPAPAPAPEPEAPPASRLPAIGRLLIARAGVAGFFAESVIVLVDHGAHGSLGLIVNRPLEVSVAELLPELPAARAHAEPAWLGGPVAQGQLLLLVRAKEPPPGSALVVDGVHVSGSLATLGALLEKPPSGVELRAYVGYAGWAPGQLDAEIAQGDWLVAPADATSVFTHRPERLWQELIRRHEMIRVDAPAKSITLSAPWRSAAASSGSRTSARARSSTR